MYTVYGIKNCQYCDAAINILKSKRLKYIYLSLQEPEQLEKLKEFRSLGRTSAPQIYLNDQYIGGYDQLMTSLKNSKFVIKRDGSREPWNAEKINNMAEWVVGADSNVQWSGIVMKAIHKLPESGDIKTEYIQKALINACLDEENIHANRVAGRALLGEIRNSCVANIDFTMFYNDMVLGKYWRQMRYTQSEIGLLGCKIDHDRDLSYGYSSYRQFKDKYCRKNADEELLEHIQYMYMGIAMSVKEHYPIEDVIKYYDVISLQKINLPSPILSTTRTITDAGVSCVLISAGDSLHGIEAAKHSAFMFTASSAGIGIEYSVRSPGDDVRKGYAKAGGKLPHYRVLSEIVKEVKQSNRGGSATMAINSLDPEITTLLKLRLPRTPDERKIDKLDYNFLVNDTLLRRAAKKQKWALVSMVDYPELYSTFYANPIRFDQLMCEILDDDTAKKDVVNAYDIVNLFLESRQEIGRYYEANMDHMNSHTPFKAPFTIRQSNLCLEIALPTIPYTHITQLYKETWDEGDGMIALCFLSAIDQYRTSDEDYEDTCYQALSSLDDTITKMKYPFPQVKHTANMWRSVGVGATNLAQKIASDGKSYKDYDYIHYLAERHYYYLLKASVRLAKERGAFEWIDKTKWVDGWLPIDTYNKNVDSVANCCELDWEGLRADVLKYGVRFSTLAAHMPCESSSGMTNSMNSLYPARYPLVYKDSKGGPIQFFTPNSDKYDYEYVWGLGFKPVANNYAIWQKFTDQTISADTFLDFEQYPNKKVSSSTRFREYLYWNKMGIKTMYYQNFKTGRGKKVTEEEAACSNCSF